jgi:hypothetical protein
VLADPGHDASEGAGGIFIQVARRIRDPWTRGRSLQMPAVVAFKRNLLRETIPQREPRLLGTGGPTAHCTCIAARQATAFLTQSGSQVPLTRYFVLVGSALFALLFLTDWYWPTNVGAVSFRDPQVEKSIIRLHSAQRWPEHPLLISREERAQVGPRA